MVVYAATFAAFLVLDAIWLTLMGQRLYAANLGPLMLAQPNLLVAAPFYFIYPAALTVLAVTPATATASPVVGALWRGALLGLAAYATYNLTNLATLNGWSTLVTIVDLAWGTTGSALAAAAGALAGTRLGRSR